MNKKKLLIIAETGISSQLFKEKFQRFIDVSGSCAEVKLASLNEFNEALKSNRPTHVLLAPNSYILEEYIEEYIKRINLVAKIIKITEEDYISMNIEKIMLDDL